MALTHEQMARLGELLDEALPLSVPERRSWLEALPATDRPLVRTLREALLDDELATRTSSPLDHPPRFETTGAGPAPSGHQAGDRLGAYELLRPLGSGGMAEVWLARRADGAFERQVALKIPHLTHVPAEMADRFARECRILATLECPGIARLYDAGVDAGVPYIAMEYVPGEPLVDWCNARGLAPPARVGIFVQVLEAVGRAHAQQVIHRDLKPSNILVTPQGEARLLDFGVARLLQTETEGASLTRVYGHALTPAYASPEMLRGEPIDPRSDIYSLGVVLHELLTGTRPGTRAAATDALATGGLSGGLREVTMKALAPAPDDRYPDAAAFAAALTHAAPALRRPASSSWRPVAMASAIGLLVLAIAAGTWWWFRPAPAQAQSKLVRLDGFQLLSADLPAAIRDSAGAEIVAAFNADGVVGVSTASAPPPGTAPAYALGGTIQHDGHAIRVVTRLTNERSGKVLWSDSFNYEDDQLSRVPRHIAVDAGNVVRCGLFGASTYGKALPDAVLGDYMQFCQGHWNPYTRDGRKALLPAQRVVAAVPDFSWGWAAVAGGYWKVATNAEDERLAGQARASGREAADRAIALDSKDTEALWLKSVLIDPHDWTERESLLKRAVADRPLDCGCEHHQYGNMLLDVGRVADAVEQLRQANDMLSLYVYTSLSLADALVAAGEPEKAKPYFDAAIDLAPDAGFAARMALYRATSTGDIEALLDPQLPISAELRAALLKGYRALAARNAGEKEQAVQALLALPEDQQDNAVVQLLGNLGADHQAFLIATRRVIREYDGPSWFWYPGMRGALSDPEFPAVAEKFGLMKYWKANHVRPDVCNETAPPPFCGKIQAADARQAD